MSVRFRKAKQFLVKSALIQKIINVSFRQFYNDMDGVCEIPEEVEQVDGTSDSVTRYRSEDKNFKINRRYLAPVLFCLLYFLDLAWNLVSVRGNIDAISG